MSIFTWCVFPTCDYSVSINSNRSLSHNRFQESYSYVAFLIWPGVLLFNGFLNLYRVKNSINKSKKSKNIITYLWSLFWSFLWTNGNKISVSRYIRYFGFFSQLSTFAFVILTISWVAKFYTIMNTNTYNTYVAVSSAVLLYGWMHTIEFMKGFHSTYTFYFTLKLVFVKDLLKILFIYVIILVGFSLSVHIFTITEPSWQETNATFLHTVYDLFGTMVGQGKLIEKSSESDEQFVNVNGNVIRLLAAIYICTSTILILNISIAATGSTFDNVSMLNDTLWCIEIIHFVYWIAHENTLKYLKLRFIFRLLLKKYIFTINDSGEPIIAQEIERNIYNENQKLDLKNRTFLIEEKSFEIHN